MKIMQPRPWVGMLAALTLILSAAPARAQQAKPALIVSLASIDNLLSDIKYVTKLVGEDGAGAQIEGAAGPILQMLDTTKPTGIVVNFDAAQQPSGLIFLPVKNFEGILQMVEGLAGIKPKDAGDGVLEFPALPGVSIFAKNANGFAFVSNSKAAVASPPANPLPLLGTLPSRYDIGIQANVQSVPEGLRTMAVAQMRSAFKAQMQMQAQFGGLSDEEAKAQQEFAERGLKQLETVINEVDELVLGLSIDQQGKSVFLETSSTAVPGGKLAKQAADLANAKSAFAGFVTPGAPATVGATALMTEEDKAGLLMWLDVVQKKAMEEIEGDAGLENADAKKAVKDVLTSFMEVIRETAKGGKMDLGATLSLSDGVAFIAGGLVADGSKLDQTFRKLIDLAKNEPNFPGVKMDAEKHGDATFHVMSMPVPAEEKEARKALGDTIEVAVGTGPNSAYVAFGKNSLTLLKKAIDDSAAKKDAPATPMLISVSLGEILKFASQMEPDKANLKAVVDSLQAVQGKDYIKMQVTPVKNGSGFRFEVGEGVLALVPKLANGEDAAEESP